MSAETVAGDTPTGDETTPVDTTGSDAGTQTDTPPADDKQDQPKDTDKSTPENKQDEVPKGDDGIPLTDDELKEFAKVGKHFVSYPKYAQTKTRLETLEKEYAEMKAQKAGQHEDEEAQKAREELKKLGYIPQDEVEEIQKQKDIEKARISEAEAFRESIGALEKKYDGSIAGLPKFEIGQLEGFMKEQNIFNPEGAYILKHLDSYINHMVQQEMKALEKVPAPTRPGANSSPKGMEGDLAKVQIGDDGFRGIIASMLKGGGQ